MVLREPSLELLLMREYLTGRISEDLILLFTSGGVRRGVWGEYRDFHRHISKLDPMSFFFNAHRCYKETSGQEQSYTLIQHSNRYSLSWLIDLRYNFMGDRVHFPYHNNLERLRKTEVLSSNQRQKVSGFHHKTHRSCWGR